MTVRKVRAHTISSPTLDPYFHPNSAVALDGFGYSVALTTSIRSLLSGVFCTRPPSRPLGRHVESPLAQCQLVDLVCVLKLPPSLPQGTLVLVVCRITTRPLSVTLAVKVPRKSVRRVQQQQRSTPVHLEEPQRPLAFSHFVIFSDDFASDVPHEHRKLRSAARHE